MNHAYLLLFVIVVFWFFHKKHDSFTNYNNHWNQTRYARHDFRNVDDPLVRFRKLNQGSQQVNAWVFRSNMDREFDMVIGEPEGVYV